MNEEDRPDLKGEVCDEMFCNYIGFVQYVGW